MTKVLVEFESIEQAQIAIAALNNQHVPAYIAAAPATPTGPAPQAYVPPAPQVAPVPQQVAPAPQAYAPPAPAAGLVAAPATSGAPASTITPAILGAAAQAYSKAYKAAGTKAVFAQFGIASVGQARPDQYQALYDALQGGKL